MYSQNSISYDKKKIITINTDKIYGSPKQMCWEKTAKTNYMVCPVLTGVNRLVEGHGKITQFGTCVRKWLLAYSASVNCWQTVLNMSIAMSVNSQSPLNNSGSLYFYE